MPKNSVSKNELAERYGISWRTVYRTLKLCKLNTSKQRYSKNEALVFKLARTLLEGGFTVKEVEQSLAEYQVLQGLIHFKHNPSHNKTNE